MKRNLWLLIPAFLVLVLTIIGCGGGGTATTTFQATNASLETTPEESLTQMLQSWASTGGPAIDLTPRLLPQTGTNASSTSITATSTPSLGTIRFKDLSGTEWNFQILNVIRGSPSTADIKARYVFGKLQDGEVTITFYLVRIEGIWRLDNIVVEQIPWVLVTSNAIQGYVRDAVSGQPVAGALVYLQGTSYQTSTDPTGVYSFKGLPTGTYTVVVVRDGYVLKTIPGVVVS